MWNVKEKNTKQDLQVVGVLVLLLACKQILAAPPEIFDDYFQQDVKVVYKIFS